MNIDAARHEAIVRDNYGNYEMYKLSLLVEWQKHLGNQATYQKLSETFEEWGNQDVNDVIKNIALKGVYECVLSVCNSVCLFFVCIYVCLWCMYTG